MKRSIHLALVTLTLAMVASGCLVRQRDDWVAQRKAYEDCLADESRTSSECDALRQGAHASAERYEADAQRAWGCGNTPEECKPPRGP